MSWLESTAPGVRPKARYWCTDRTDAEPSPTAVATRFIDPDRKSPMAKRPGWLVSNGSGDRSSDAQPSPSCSGVSERSVGTKPRLVERCAAVEPTRGRVRSDEGEQSSAREDDRAVGTIELNGSQRLVPVQGNDGRARAKRDVGVRIDSLDQIARHVLVRDPGRRMTSVTAHPLWLRKMAACPAELPPPTITTGEGPHMRASISVAA